MTSNIIRGTAGSLGTHTGIARIILSSKDIKKLKQGDVLVTVMTSTEWSQAFSKAGAFVTDTGGFTSHAVLVARKLKIPCVVGTRNATKLIKDGYKIKVDGNRGEVIIIDK